MTLKHWLTSTLALGAILAAQPSAALVVYGQSFNTDTASTAQTLASYGLTNDGISNAVVESGVLRLTPNGAQANVIFGAFTGNVVVAFDATIIGSAGAINVGLRVGDNNYIFHPTLVSGAFRIDGPDGTGTNVDMGFTPSAGFSRVTVAIDALTGHTNIKVADGSSLYERAFLDANYVAGTTVFGLSTGGSGTGLFDNLSVTDDRTGTGNGTVPEPSAFALALLALCALRVAAARPARGGGTHPA